MAEQNLTPPVPKKVEHRREHHGDVFIDHYEWLRDKGKRRGPQLPQG